MSGLRGAALPAAAPRCRVCRRADVAAADVELAAVGVLAEHPPAAAAAHADGHAFAWLLDVPSPGRARDAAERIAAELAGRVDPARLLEGAGAAADASRAALAAFAACCDEIRRRIAAARSRAARVRIAEQMRRVLPARLKAEVTVEDPQMPEAVRNWRAQLVRREVVAFLEGEQMDEVVNGEIVPDGERDPVHAAAWLLEVDPARATATETAEAGRVFAALRSSPTGLAALRAAAAADPAALGRLAALAQRYGSAGLALAQTRFADEAASAPEVADAARAAEAAVRLDVHLYGASKQGRLAKAAAAAETPLRETHLDLAELSKRTPNARLLVGDLEAGLISAAEAEALAGYRPEAVKLLAFGGGLREEYAVPTSRRLTVLRALAARLPSAEEVKADPRAAVKRVWGDLANAAARARYLARLTGRVAELIEMLEDRFYPTEPFVDGVDPVWTLFELGQLDRAQAEKTVIERVVDLLAESPEGGGGRLLFMLPERLCGSGDLGDDSDEAAGAIFGAETVADLAAAALDGLKVIAEELLPEARALGTTDETRAFLGQVELWRAAADYLQEWAAALKAEGAADVARPRPLAKDGRRWIAT